MNIDGLIEANRGDCLNRQYTNEELQKKSLVQIGGIGLGYLAQNISMMTGPHVALHEIIGHGWLGFNLTNTYPEGGGPTYVIHAFDNIKDVFNSETIEDVIKAIGKLIAHPYVGGELGYTSSGWSRPNELGKELGYTKQRAWISLAGSIPGLALNTLTVVAGMKIREKNDFLGTALITYGMLEHLTESSYSMTAAVMTEEQLRETAMHGHDFANFAVKMSEVTGIAPKTIAIGTAVLWTAFVPAIALGLYFYQRSQRTKMVPDHIALQQWLQECKNDPKKGETLGKLLAKCPDKENRVKCTEYLIEHLPKKELEASKKKVLANWEKLQKPSKGEKALKVASFAGSTISVATKVIQVLGDTITPALGPIATGLTYASPLLTGVSVITSGYETYTDLKSDNKKVPIAAKVLSVAKLVITVVSSTMIVVSLFVPGLNVVMIVGITLGTGGSLILGVAKYHIVKESFAISQSVQKETWDYMHSLLKVYKDKKPKKLRKWINLQQKARGRGMLSDEQIQKLVEVDIFSN